MGSNTLISVLEVPARICPSLVVYRLSSHLPSPCGECWNKSKDENELLSGLYFFSCPSDVPIHTVPSVEVQSDVAVKKTCVSYVCSKSFCSEYRQSKKLEVNHRSPF